MRKTSIRRALIFGALAVAWGGVLFFFSGQTNTDSDALSLSVVRILFGWLLERGWNIGLLDHLTRKTAHFVVFAAEGSLLGFSLLSALRTRWAVLLTAAACCTVAALNEIHQIFIPGRAFGGMDIVLDSLGALTGLLLAWILYTICTRRHNKKINYDR